MLIYEEEIHGLKTFERKNGIFFLYSDFLHRVFHYQSDKLAGDIVGTWTMQNPIAMQGRKCRNCEYWCKEAEKKSRNTSTSMGQKTFYWKMVLQMTFEIIAKNRQAHFTGTLRRRLFILVPRTSVAARRIHDTLEIFQNRRDSTRRYSQDWITTSVSNFEHLVKYNLSIKCFLSH